MPSTPQRQREHGSSPSRQANGYPHGMYGGMPGHHYNGAPPMQMKPEFESSPQRYGGPPQGPYGGPQGYHPLNQPGGVGQFGQYNPYYAGYANYFPPNHAEFAPRGPGFGGPFPSQSSNRSKQLQRDPTSQTSPNEKSPPPTQIKPATTSPSVKESPTKDLPPLEPKPTEKTKTEKKTPPPSAKKEEEKSETPIDNGDEELTSGVNPMRTDFHFFASDQQNGVLEKINAKCKEMSSFDRMTELNERILSLWESSPSHIRSVYMQKEESDRYRFMSEDEIASRHCATLTSRTSTRKNDIVPNPNDSPPKSSVKRQSSETVIDDIEKSEYESPTKKPKEDKAEDKEEEKTEEKDIPIEASKEPEEASEVVQEKEEKEKSDKKEEDTDKKVDSTEKDKEETEQEKDQKEKTDEKVDDTDVKVKEPEKCKEETKQEEQPDSKE